ncbi:FmdB family zinc ribbon protein [Streptomyces niveus]|uniref:FmdB family zinc ribbon protein n=1 Tax=Streptomyces niveus TaxID=193462 RepID=UPI00369D0D15
MPRYEYRCRPCDTTFELSRPMAESSAAATCPAGHQDTVKMLSTVAVGGSAKGSPAPVPSAGGGGGCCGGGCCS